MSGHLFQVWILYFKAKDEQNQRVPGGNEKEMETMIQANQN